MAQRDDDDDEREDMEDDAEERRPLRSGRTQAASRVAGPAISLMVCAGLHMALGCIGIPFNIYALTQAAGGGPGLGGQFAGNPVANLIGGFIALAIQGFILFGAIQMKKLSTYGVALAAAILSVIPCCSSCLILGIPFGVWALIVLMDQDVKSAFR
jgi:hypothetical protein